MGIMKYWNKDKHVRQRCWHHVPIDRCKLGNYSWNDIKRAVQLHPSSGKFHMDFPHATLSFSLKADAVYFALLWG